MTDRAIVYLPEPESVLWAGRRVAGRSILLRVVQAASRAGIRTIGLPEVLRPEAEEWGLGPVEAAVVWLDRLSPEERSAFTAAPVLLLPANALLSPTSLRTLAGVGGAGDGVAPEESKGSSTPVLLAPPGLVVNLWEPLQRGTPLGEEVEAYLRGGRPTFLSGEGAIVSVTDAGGFRAAEEALYQSLGTEADSLVDRFINRRGSRLLTRFLIRLPVTPNQVSLMSLALGLAGVWSLWNATVPSALLGLGLYTLAVVVDHSDGEIARLTFQESAFGEWLDFSIDTLIHAGLVLAMGMTAQSVGGALMVIAGGFGAFGVIMSALFTRFLSKSGQGKEPLGNALRGMGNRDPFYLVLAAFILSLWQAPGLLPLLVGILAVGSQAYWLTCLAQRWLASCR
jgi:phosphatidylglycerophosphate synthase